MYMWVYEEYNTGWKVRVSATDTWTNSEQFTCLCADKDILGPS